MRLQILVIYLIEKEIGSSTCMIYFCDSHEWLWKFYKVLKFLLVSFSLCVKIVVVIDVLVVFDRKLLEYSKIVLLWLRAVLYGTISLLDSAVIEENTNFTWPAIGLLRVNNIFKLNPSERCRNIFSFLRCIYAGSEGKVIKGGEKLRL